MTRKTISMPDKMSDWISGRIERGQFNNESEYFRDLVRRDQEEEARRSYLKARLEQGDRPVPDSEVTTLSSGDDIDRFFEMLDD